MVKEVLREMPANLTPEYLRAEERFRAARTVDEKIEALEHMLAVIPRHKGTDHIYGQLKSKLSKLRAEKTKKSATARHSPDYRVEPEGAGQVVLLGAPNAGKSSLLAALTNAQPEVTSYPFATRNVLPGMMMYEDCPIQLIDTPSIAADFFDPLMLTLVRNADRALLVIDLTADEVIEQPAWVIDTLEQKKVRMVPMDTDLPAFDVSIRNLPTLILANKADEEDAMEILDFVKEEWGQRFPILPVSVNQPQSLDALRKQVFESLRIVRVYSKMQGKKPDFTAPFILPVGATVLDFAAKVHRDFKERFAYARVWGHDKVEGRRISREYVLQDQDVIELHLS
jgi:small GTP-binding protein